MAGLRLLETIRDPMAEARNRLSLAVADLNGTATRLAAGEILDIQTIRNVVSRWDLARDQADRAVFCALGVESINGRPLNAADTDDMLDALIHRLELNKQAGRAKPYGAGLPEAHSPWG